MITFEHTKRLTVNSDVDNIGPSSGRSNHASSGDTGSVMRMDMNGKIWVRLPDSTNETERKLGVINLFCNGLGDAQFSGFGFQETSHIFHAKDVDTFRYELLDEIEVILQGIFGFLGAGAITAVANYSFNNTPCFFSRIDTETHLKNNSSY